MLLRDKPSRLLPLLEGAGGVIGAVGVDDPSLLRLKRCVERLRKGWNVNAGPCRLSSASSLSSRWGARVFDGPANDAVEKLFDRESES